MSVYRQKAIRNTWLLAFIGFAAFVALIFALNLPSQISIGEKGQAADHAMDAVKRPFLEIKKEETLLIWTDDIKRPTISDFNKAVESGNALLAAYRKAAEYNPRLSMRVAKLSEAYTNWVSVERKLLGAFQKDFAGENDKGVNAQMLRDMNTATALFLYTMNQLGEGGSIIYADIDGGRRAGHILILSLGGLFIYLVGLIFLQQRARKLELESQVDTRTYDLNEANKNLRQEIAERKHVEEEVKNSLSLLNATLESTADGILVVNNEGKIVIFNQRFVDMWRIPESVVASHDDNQALAFVLEQLKEPEAFLAKVRELYSQSDAESYDILEFKDGRVFERYSRPQLIEGKGVGRVWSFRDATERKLVEKKIKHMAYHDSLTDLPNRALFYDRLQQAILAGHRENEPVALMFLDMDDFKKVNDTHGHHYGDLLLKQLSRRLRGVLRESDTVARLGGDEFAIILPRPEKIEGAVRTAEKIMEATRAPFSLNETTLNVTVSIGIAVFPKHGEDIDLLTQRADTAMYTAKRSKKGFVVHGG